MTNTSNEEAATGAVWHLGNYWQYYGLSFEPFSDVDESLLDFALPQWDRYLDLLYHLTHYSNGLLVVTGGEGAGKSTLMRRQLAALGHQMPYCIYRADAYCDLAQFIETLCRDANITLQNPSLPLTLQLESISEQLAERSRQLLVVVDDAQNVPEDIIEGILLVVSRQVRHKASLHFTLYGTPSLAQRVASVGREKGFNSELTHILSLQPLSLDETYSYLRHRMITAGLKDLAILSTSRISQLHKQTGGVPAQINEVARQMFCDLANGKESLTPPKKRVRRVRKKAVKKRPVKAAPTSRQGVASKSPMSLLTRPAGLLVSTLVLSALAVTILFHSGEPAKQTPVAVKARDSLVAATDVLPVPNVKAPAPKKEVIHLSYMASPRMSAGVLMYPAFSAPPLPQKTQLALARPAPKAAAKPKPAVKVAAVPKAKQGQRHLTMDEKLLLSVPDSHYTIQLMGAYDVSDLMAYEKQNHLLGSVMQFHTFNQDKDWYVVSFGNFKNYQQAKAHMASLSEGVKINKPWVRSYASVKKAIREMPKQEA